MVLSKTCDYCPWERGRRVPATVNTGRDYSRLGRPPGLPSHAL